jgi:hypothetical protein
MFKALRAIGIAAALLSLAAAPVQAAYRSEDPVGKATDAAIYGCVTQGHTSAETGRLPRTSSNEDGVSASWYMPANHDYDHCAFDLLMDDGVSTWVALVPGQGNTGYNTAAAILQMGIIDCDYPTDYCNGLRWWMADGGCNGDGPIAELMPFVGPADYLPHKYRINIYTNDVTFYIDDTIVFTYPKTDARYQHIACWADGTKDIAILAEKDDGGDNLGALGGYSNAGYFDGMKRRYGGTWHDLTGTTCEYLNSYLTRNEGCTAGGTYMYIWTQ